MQQNLHCSCPFYSHNKPSHGSLMHIKKNTTSQHGIAQFTQFGVLTLILNEFVKYRSHSSMS